jgi:hypothetical protein
MLEMANIMTEALNIALKEWAVACRALETGRQIMLLRKGGIHESSAGFELEHMQFLLFPTYLHQNLQMLKPEAHPGFEIHSAEPQTITIRSAAEVTDIIQLKRRDQMDALADEHIWTPPLIDMRFNYKPQNPLYLLLVRAYTLAHATTIQNTPAYAGCKSWVPLDQSISTTSATPVLSDDQYDIRQRQLFAALPA